VQSIRGSRLKNYVESPAFAADSAARVGELCALDAALSPYVADDSFTNNYSNNPQAAFYRRLQEFHPGLVDVVLGCTDTRRREIASAVALLNCQHYVKHPARAANAIQAIDRSSVLYFLLHCAKKDFLLARTFFADLANATPEDRALQEAFAEVRAALALQSAWRKHVRPRGIRESPGGAWRYVVGAALEVPASHREPPEMRPRSGSSIVAGARKAARRVRESVVGPPRPGGRNDRVALPLRLRLPLGLDVEAVREEGAAALPAHGEPHDIKIPNHASPRIRDLIQTNADGIVIQTNQDGTKIQRNPDGKQIDTLAVYGTQVQTNPDGTQIKLKGGSAADWFDCFY